MMKKYPEFSRGQIDKVYKKFSPKNKKIIDDFAQYCRISASEHKVKDIKRSILQFYFVVEKDLNKITLQDIRDFLVLLNQTDREAWSKHDTKSHIKRFLKWYYKDWSNRFNDLKEMRIESVGLNEQKINSETLLKKDEIKKIVDNENDIQKKTFFLALYESALRPGELRTIKWQDIKLNSDGELSEINLFMNKNKGHKTVYVKDSSHFLKKLKSEVKGEYVFESREKKGEPIGDSTATRWINELGVHIGRKIYPYLLRHSRSQELYELVDENKLSENVVLKFMGHKKSMRDVYSRLSNKTLKEAVLKTIYKFEELSPEKKSQLELELGAVKEKLAKREKLDEIRSEYENLNQEAVMLLLSKPREEILRDGDAMKLMKRIAELKSKIDKLKHNKPEGTEDRFVAYVEK